MDGFSTTCLIAVPLTCNDTLSSVPLGLTNVKEYPSVNPISSTAYILAANACNSARGIFSSDHIVKLSGPIDITTVFDRTSEVYCWGKRLQRVQSRVVGARQQLSGDEVFESGVGYLPAAWDEELCLLRVVTALLVRRRLFTIFRRSRM